MNSGGCHVTFGNTRILKAPFTQTLPNLASGFHVESVPIIIYRAYQDVTEASGGVTVAF